MLEFLSKILAFGIALFTEAFAHWLGLIWFVVAYFFLEFMEHSKSNKWNPELKIFNWKIGKWLNTRSSWRNKDNYGGDSKFWDFMFDTFLVFLTDGEHLFQFLMFAFIGIGVGNFTESTVLGTLAFLSLGFFGGGLKTILQKLFPKKFKIQ